MQLCLAPMDGITDCAYRIIVKKIFERYNFGDDFWMFTEFMNADGYMINPSKLVKHLMKTEYEKPLVAQIYGGDHDMLLKAAIDIDLKYDFQGIELNIGCPSPKVMACGGGSGMLKEKKNTIAIIQKISDSISRPFSIKTRIGLSGEDREEQKDFLLEASQYCKMITIHGRTYKQSHSGFVDRDFVYDIKNNVGEKCKIIGNGGVTSYEDALTKLGNLDGVMIGQAAIGNPRIFTPHTPTKEEIFQTAWEHLHLMLATEEYFKVTKFVGGKLVMPSLDQLTTMASSISQHPEIDHFRGVIEFRKYLFNYVSGIPFNKEFKVAIAQTKSYVEVVEEMKKFFSI